MALAIDWRRCCCHYTYFQTKTLAIDRRSISGRCLQTKVMIPSMNACNAPPPPPPPPPPISQSQKHVIRRHCLMQGQRASGMFRVARYCKIVDPLSGSSGVRSLVSKANSRSRRSVGLIFSQIGSIGRVSDEDQTEDQQRPSFDLHLAVLLAGFAFESYTTPTKQPRSFSYVVNSPTDDAGVREVDGGGCQTVYLAGDLFQKIYDGQLFLKLERGAQLPGFDLWGTSDPYVVFRVGESAARSRTIWVQRDPVWNEDLTINVSTSAGHDLRVAVWDANVVSADRRLGNASVSLQNICDGKRHDVELRLEGMGGGGNLFFQVQFKSFAQIEEEKSQFSLAGLFNVDVLASASRSILEARDLTVGEFMKVFQSFGNAGLDTTKLGEKTSLKSVENASPFQAEDGSKVDPRSLDNDTILRRSIEKSATQRQTSDTLEDGNSVNGDGDKEGWTNLVKQFSEALEPFGLDMSQVLSDENCVETMEDLERFGVESQKKAEAVYAENGLAIVEGGHGGEDETCPFPELDRSDVAEEAQEGPISAKAEQQMLEGVLKQTEGIVGAWAMFNRAMNNDLHDGEEEISSSQSEREIRELDTPPLPLEDQADAGMWEKKKTLFNTTESAMEAWALLSTTLGGASLVKSDFEKICFIENEETDTQAAVWRDSRRQRLVVAFRGTEQTKWKDVVTDVSLLPSGFNPERVTGGSNLKDEPLVHSGFLKAYDSVKRRLLSIVRSCIEKSIDPGGDLSWHIYVTGHSLGGALATLFALEVSSSNLAKDRHFQVTMYNYGSPRVGNRVFADDYNKIVKDSWRVVNHRDIVPTIPRLMGYSHIAQPVYLTAEESYALVSPRSLDDGYRGDVIGEATLDVIFEKFMKGEQKLLQRLLDTEVTMLRAMRSGSAVMQHMEDFYYITLLQRVHSAIPKKLES